MSNKREDGSDMKREFQSLWQNTVKQFDGIKDALVESSQAGMAKLDATLLRRERDQKLATLGEALLVMVAEGKLVLPEGLQGTVERIEELEAEIASQEGTFRKVFHKDPQNSSSEGPGTTKNESKPSDGSGDGI